MHGPCVNIIFKIVSDTIMSSNTLYIAACVFSTSFYYKVIATVMLCVTCICCRKEAGHSPPRGRPRPAAEECRPRLAEGDNKPHPLE